MKTQSYEFGKYKVTLQLGEESDGDSRELICVEIQDTSIPEPSFDPMTYLADYNCIARIYPSGIVLGNLPADK